MNNLKGHIYGLISEIASAEKITKVKLGILSRDMLTYVMDSQDIEAVNRLLEVLTPVNKSTATLYFCEFLPWEQEKTKEGAFHRFGKKVRGDKKVMRAQDKIYEWLSDESNNLWAWADKNIEVEVKKKDFAGMVTRAITKALEGDEKSDTPAIDKATLMKAIMSGGVSIEDMLTAIETEENYDGLDGAPALKEVA